MMFICQYDIQDSSYVLCKKKELNYNLYGVFILNENQVNYGNFKKMVDLCDYR